MIDKQLEQFALADDREAVLDKMIPGSEDAFSYRCLHLQNEGRLDEADALIEQAHARGVRQQLLDRLRDRQALLRFESDPARSCARVQERLGLSFTPARARSSEAEEYPSALDPELIDREYLTPHMLQARDLSWISDEGIAWVLERYAAETRATKLLGRVQQPDHPRLVDEILRGLDSDRRTTFGGLEIHKNLCWAQYRELVHRRPLLLQEEAFVSACLHRLAPPEGCELARDREARGAYHERLWSLVSGLAPKFEPLKKHVLYYMLEHGRAGGEYDRARFLEYLALAGDARFAKTKTEVRGRVSASSFTRELVEMPAVTSDEPLVRDFLITLLRDAEDYQAFAELVREDFLRRAFAEAKILYGAADVERAYALLDSGARKELVDRVELEFAETTPRYFELDEGAGVLALELDVKNVQTLVVKVFEINLFNYFAAHGRDVDTSIDLDGLVATSEQTYRYDEPPQRRARRRFEFPQLAGPGVYVVEFIGGGKSSRALIRRGRLRFTHRLSAAGHALQVVDAAGQVRADATMWLSGREYKPDEDGQIFVPFAADRGGQRRFLLRLGEVITVESFTLLTEAYAFSAAIHVEREALIAGQRAEVVVRPQLRVHGEPVSVSLIKRARLRIESTDLHGVSTSMEVGRFPLHDHQESVHSFQVPEGLRSLCFTVLGAVHNRARGQDVDVSATATVRVNGIDSMTQVASLHLARGQGGYVLHALGKAGEPRAAQRLTVTFHHRLFSRTIAETLQTDARGQVELGALVDILKLDVRAPTGIAGGTWTLPVDRCSLPELVHARAGETISLSRPADVPTTREGYSLLMVRRGQPLRDCFEQLVFPERGAARGTVQLQDLEPGRYELRYKRSGQLVQIVVAEGEHVRGAARRWIDAGARLLEAWRNRPLSLARVSVDAERDELQIHVVGPKYRPRVHLLASRFVADRPGERALAPSRELAGVAGQLEFPSPRSEFQAGRDIGDEYRYILERRSAQRRYPGNLLARPQLLLDPWAVRGTDTQVAAAASGSAYASGAASPMRSTSRMMRREDRAAAPRDASATLDFLARPGLALYNLRPGDDGVVRVSLDQLAGVHELRVVVVGRDGDALVHHAHAPHAALELRERRLLPGFDPAQHLAQRREATALRPGEALTVDDLSLATVERYDTLARAFELLATLGSGRVTLEKFRFILDWPALTPEERRERYSEYACHELNLLLARKDPAFFAEVIRPHLEHKREREFIDDYLLEADLSPYRESWAYARLNAVERILLAGRLGGALAEATRRDFQDRVELLPPDPERENRLFDTALKGRALEGGDEGGAPPSPPPPPRSPAPAALAAQVRSLGTGRGGGGGDRRRRAASSLREVAFDEVADEDIDNLFNDGGAAPAEAEEAESEVAYDMDDEADGFGGPPRGAGDLSKRDKSRPNFRAPEKTQEWAETHYYRRELKNQGPGLVSVNAFWLGALEHELSSEPGAPFVSPHLAQAAGDFTEMMFALALIGLPWTAEAPTRAPQGRGVVLTARSPAIAFHRQIRPARTGEEDRGLLVRHHYLRADDRVRLEGGQEVEKHLRPRAPGGQADGAADEFLTHVVYECKVVVTNATSRRRKLELLLQIPAGAMTVAAGHVTRGVHCNLEPYSTQRFEYAFYFPRAGAFTHYPAQASEHGALLAAAEPALLDVVEVASKRSRDTWPHIVEHGDDADVLEFLRTRNVQTLGDGLARVAERMYDRAMYERTLATLRARQLYCGPLWAFSVYHRDGPALAEYLRHEGGFLDNCGPALRCALLTIDPFARRRYQHLEYAPLINARAHRFANHPTILNNRFAEQWTALLRVLSHKPHLEHDDRLAVAYYLLLQDRTDEGLAMFARVDREAIAARMQYDYLAIYAAFFEASAEARARARALASAWKDTPVKPWRARFQGALAQLDELAGGGAGDAGAAADERDRDARHDHLARTEASFDFTVEGGAVALRYHNLERCRVHYYRMDIELLFSRQPFVQEQSGQFAFIAPNLAFTHELAAREGQVTFAIPDELAGANVLIEVVAAGQRKSCTHYANSLSVRLISTYGQVRVAHERTGAPLARVYVKAYARQRGGATRFYKDGYTDLRGVFDYASLSSDELDRVERFALLILSEEHGAVIREVAPPER